MLGSNFTKRNMFVHLEQWLTVSKNDILKYFATVNDHKSISLRHYSAELIQSISFNNSELRCLKLDTTTQAHTDANVILEEIVSFVPKLLQLRELHIVLIQHKHKEAQLRQATQDIRAVHKNLNVVYTMNTV